MRRTWLLGIPLALAGCQTWGPTWSEVTGKRFHVTGLNRSATIIESIDGKGAFPNRPGQPIWVEPGKHAFTLQGMPLRPGWQGTLQELVLELEPCKRYYLNAQFTGPLTPSQWTPVVDHVEPVTGCKADPQVKP